MITNKFSIKEAFQESWDLYSDNFSLFLLPLIIWGGLLILRFKLTQTSLLFSLGIMFTLIVVTFGIVKVFLRLYNERDIKLADFLLEGQTYFRLVIISLIIALFNKFSSIIFLSERFSIELGLTLAILVMIIWVFLFIRLSFMVCFVIEQQQDIKTAFHSSLQLTENSSFDLYILLGIMSIVGLSGIFPGVFIGMIFLSIPLNIGAFVFVYKKLLEE
ncbi:MAG: hypothetical protein ACQEP9_01985 [Bacillota bacterium]